jgi:hypothetical protein
MGDLIINRDQEITDILPELIRRIGDIDSLSLFALTTESQPDRVVDRPEMKDVVAEALQVRKEYKVPFWEAVLLIARNKNGRALDLVLDAASYHQPTSEAEAWFHLTAADGLPRRIKEITATADGQRVIALSSKVTTKSTQSPAHLQMLDFRIRPNEENEKLASEILKRAGVEGILLNSGNSYHFYGYHLMRSDSELSSFLGKVSLYAPFIDQRWVAHQLIEGACALRISRGKSFPKSPEFVRYI